MTVGQQIANVGGRRFFMAMGAGIIHSGMLVAGILPVEAYVTLQIATVGAYIAGNTLQRFSSSWESSSQSQPSSLSDSSEPDGTTGRQSPKTAVSPPIT